MKTYKKIYIGKGKKVANLDIIKISFNVADIMDLTHNYKGEDYLSFELAKMKEPDQFGNEYTAYVNKLEEAPEPATASEVNDTMMKPAGKAKKTSSPKAPKAAKEKVLEPSDEIPF